MGISTGPKQTAYHMAYAYLDRDPEVNLPHLLDWVDQIDAHDVLREQREAFRRIIADRNSNWYKLLCSLWTNVGTGVRRKLFENIVLHAAILSAPIRAAARARYGCDVPCAIFMDPTDAHSCLFMDSRTADDSCKPGLDFDTLDSVICQGKEIGIYLYAYAGCELLARKRDLIALCNKHQDCTFLAFTNGTCIDKPFAADMRRVKNLILAISVAELATETDALRGKGTLAKVRAATSMLLENSLPFGVFCRHTSGIVSGFASEAWFDKMIALGAKFALLFPSLPTGGDAGRDQMPAPEQRAFISRRVLEFRKTKPLYTVDFCNDTASAGGCIAGRRHFLTINAAGNVGPCAFIHNADANIHTGTLIQALQTPFFACDRTGHPLQGSARRLCPLMDNPG